MNLFKFCELTSGQCQPETWIAAGYYSGQPFISIRLPLFQLGWLYEFESDSHRFGWATPQVLFRKEYKGLMIRWRMAFHSDLFGEEQVRETSLRKLPIWGMK